MGPGDLILHDGLAHNSIVQGAILSGARRRPFAHNDWREADRLLTDFRHEYRRVLIAIEGVYSMDGDMPDLPKFIEVKKRHQAMLMIDEAHSMGVLGRTAAASANSSTSIAATSMSGWARSARRSAVAADTSPAARRWSIICVTPRRASCSRRESIRRPPPRALAAIRVLEKQPERFARLRENSALFLSLCKERGMNTGTSKDSPVVPIILGNSIHALMLSRAMLARGVNVMPILHPAVEESAARLAILHHLAAHARGDSLHGRCDGRRAGKDRSEISRPDGRRRSLEMTAE